MLLGAHTRLRAVRPGWPLVGPLAELALALVRPHAVKTEEEALKTEAREILALFGDRLTPRLDHAAYSLSYANRRRVEIARALALRPRLLLLDEPTAGMNPTETAEMQALIATLKARGVTILLIEHKLEIVMQLSDRVYVLDDGAKIAEGPPADRAQRSRCHRSLSGPQRRRRRRTPSAEAGLAHERRYSASIASTRSTAPFRSTSTFRSRSARARSSRCSAATPAVNRRR